MASDPLLGQTVGGCEILEIIGQGGMGVIYKSRQKSLDRVVALKVLARHLATDVNFVARFQKEARAIAKVNHPNILAVYDVGDDNNTNYMIMELIDGQSLAELQAERRGAIPWEEATDYVRQASQGLEAAQAAGIIHRDIKPENLMVTKKNQIKVSDFGLAKESDASSGNTSVDAVMGTPAFMSPEQCDGKKVDGRSDIYSLGGTFYRLVSGRLPFEAETAMSMMYRHKHEALIPPNEIVPTVPQAISAIIVKMMAKKREQRYQTLTEVIDAIDAARKPGASNTSAALPAAPVQPPMSARSLPAVQEYGAPPGAHGGDSFNAPGDAHDRFGAAPADDAGASNRMRPAAQSGRLPVQPGVPVGFGAGDSTSTGMHMPTSVMGMTSVGMGTPDEGYTNVSRGDELMGRGDRLAGLKYYRHAMKSTSLDQATRARIEGELQKEVTSRRQAAESLLKRGMLVEASRECRVLVELDPNDELSKTMLKDLDSKLAQKRTMVNDIRQAIAASQFERAIKVWESTSPELRDESLGKQVEQLRSVVVPAMKLAEQGDSMSQQGRLEEAISSFEDALKINPTCEPARMGLQDAQQKVQRIEFMLKEGFQASLEQNYEKAVETWKPILLLRPGHPQAVKSIVDAYMAHAQNLRAHGELEGALAAYKGAAETDPQNRAARRALEELTNLHDKEQALIDRAQDAAARNRLGEAVGYWKEVQRINPTSKKAGTQISQLSRQRSGGLFKASVVLLVLGAAGGGIYEFYYEHEELSTAKTLMKNKKYSEAKERLSAAHILFQKAEREALLLEADVEVETEQAKSLEEDKHYPEAASAYQKLGERFADDRRRQIEMFSNANVCKVKHYIAQGTLSLEQKKWSEASDYFREVSLINQGGKMQFTAVVPFEQIAEKGTMIADKMAHVSKVTDVRVRQKERGEAKKLAEELNFASVSQFIETEMKSETYRPDDIEKWKEEGKKALSQKPPDFKGAKEAFAKIKAQGGLTDETVQMFLRYIEDVEYCEIENKGMVMFASTHPTTNGEHWGNDERKNIFCVDRYEFPNKEGDMPTAGVSFLQARAHCKARDADLCLRTQWEAACKGPVRVNMFPYGPDPDEEACNTNGTAPVASGSKTKCKNALGIYDMSGNLAEWVRDDENNPWIMGGSFKSKAAQANCVDSNPEKAEAAAPSLGFRCCKPLK